MVRRSPSERIAALEARKRQIEAQLAALTAREKQAARRRDARRKIIVGAAVLAHAEIDGRFAALLLDVLRRAVQRPADQLSIADLLNPQQPQLSLEHTEP